MRLTFLLLVVLITACSRKTIVTDSTKTETTTEIKNEDVGEQGMPLNQDNERFDSLMAHFADVVIAKDRLAQSNIDLEEKNRQYLFLYQREQEIKNKAREGAFIPTKKRIVGEDSIYVLDLFFDQSKNPQFTVSGHVKKIKEKQTINTEKTIYIQPTVKDAFIKLWWLWVLMITAIIVSFIVKTLIK